MKTPLSRIALLALSTLLVDKARADFNPAVAAADSKWIVYADLNALRASAIGKELITLGEKQQFQMNDGKIRVDIEKVLATVGSITAYGSNFSKDPALIDGSLIAQGTPDLKKIAVGLLAQATVSTPDKVTEVKDLPFETYAVAGAKGSDKGQVFIGFPPENIVLVSKSKAQLLRAREVFTGRAPSLAKDASSPLSALVPNAAGATLFSASLVPPDQMILGDAPQARLLRMAHSGSFALGDDGSKTFAHVELLASSDDMADKLMKILQGMTAMMSLASTNDQQLNDFLNSAAVTRKGDTVSLALSYSSASVAQMIESAFKTQGPRNPVNRGPRSPVGKVVSEWQTQAAAADGTPAPAPTFVWHTVEGIHLLNGSTVSLSAMFEGKGKGASFERIEVQPSEGPNQPLVFRAQFMKPLVGFRVEEAPADSGIHGKVAVSQGRFGLAQFEFPGEDGNYRIRVRYLAAPDADAKLTLGVKDPEARAEPAATENAGRTDTK